MFTSDDISARFAPIERLRRGAAAVEDADLGFEDDLAATEAEARRFEFVKELVTAPALGTS